MQHVFFRATFVVIVILFVLHCSALVYGFYDTFFWFDMLTHFFGGIVVVLGGSAFLSTRLPRFTRVKNLVMFVVGVGLLWELYEYLVQIVIPATPFVTLLDSLSDLGFDILGGIVGIAFVYLIKKQYTNNNGN